MLDKVRLGFIGSGYITRSHLDQGLKDFEDVEFVGWCDLNEETAAARREQVGGAGEIYTDAREMLDKAKPDAVYIMLPPFAHGEAEALVIERKLPFFIEKPVAIDMDTAKTVAEGVEKNNLITSVGYQARYRRSPRRVRELLQDQKAVFLHGGWVWAGPENYEGSMKWWVQKDKSGGQFLEQTTHLIDMARYLFGDVTRVYAVSVKGRRERPDFYTIEDASMVQLTFANGAAGNIYSSCCTSQSGEGAVLMFGGGGTAGLHVWGTEMSAELPFIVQSVNTKIYLADEKVEEIPEENVFAFFALENRAFIDSVKAGKNIGILATYDDGVKALAIACAANKSMETGEVVELEV